VVLVVAGASGLPVGDVLIVFLFRLAPVQTARPFGAHLFAWAVGVNHLDVPVI
jgi:hypothetical protein